MNNERERIDNFAVKEYIKLYQSWRNKSRHLIVIACITLCAWLKRIKEIVYYFVQRQVIVHLNTVQIKVLHILEGASSFLTQIHYTSDIFWRCVDICFYHRLFGNFYFWRIGVICRVVNVNRFAVCLCYLVYYWRGSCNKVKIIFTFKSFLDYLHMKKS